MEKVSDAIADALSYVTGTPSDEGDPLYRAIDTDCLNGLFTYTNNCVRDGIEVSFSAEGCDVTVNSDGDLTLEKRF
jgi:hypothetical protein